MKITVAAQAAALLAALPAAVVAGPGGGPGPKCRYLPGDAKWPSASKWKSLNNTVKGRLIATEYLAAPCHDPNYDAEVCASLQSQWLNPQLHMESSSSIMAPFFANQSCDPFTPTSQPCTLGNYVSYAVNASSASDIQAAVKFAEKENIRLVIRNTGHDYNARSTGTGALSVWTHYLKSAKVTTYKDSFYSGKALTLGAGVQGWEAMAVAKEQGLVVVGGECSTVGVTGGYTQGGGHSALSTNFGLGADQTLSMKVVTADGKLVTASRTKNSDLYWALSGGGGGTYGIVVEMTVKAYPDAIVGGGTLFFSSEGLSTDTFYAGIEAFHTLLPAMVDAGSMVVYYFGAAFFTISPLTAYGKTAQEVETIMAPFVSALNDLNITFTHAYSSTPTYWDHYDKYFGPLPYGNINVGIAQYGGRLISRDSVTKGKTAFSAVSRNITQNGVLFIGVGTDVSSPTKGPKAVSNSVLPAWRKTLIHATLTTDWSFTAPWADMIALQDKMTNEIMPQIEAVTPGMGAYMNEADFRQPRWKEEFFGSNYGALLKIKKKYDPKNLFYALKTVGSDAWNVAADGRMCRA